MPDLDTIVLARSGLVSYLKLDETSGTSAADSKGSNTGTYNGGFTLGQAIPIASGKAVTLNGSTGRVQVPYNANIAFDATAGFTIACWIKTSNSGGNGQRLVSRYTPGGAYPGYDLGLESDGRVKLYVGNSSQVDSVYTVNNGQWHHVVGTYQGTTAKVYIDGLLAGTATLASPSLVSTADIQIGSPADLGPAWFGGTIGRVALYNRAITADEVMEEWLASGFPAAPLRAARPAPRTPILRRDLPIASGLVVACPMTSGVGRVKNLVTGASDVAASTAYTWADSAFGKALSIVGLSADSGSPRLAHASVNRQSFTGEIWITYRSFSAQGAFSYRGLFTSQDYATVQLYTGANSSYNPNMVVTQAGQAGAAPIMAGWPTQIVYKGSASELAVFVNGRRVAAFAAGSSATWTQTELLNDSAAGSWIQTPDALVHQFNLWNRTLSDAEIARRWQDPWEFYRPRIAPPALYSGGPRLQLASGTVGIGLGMAASGVRARLVAGTMGVGLGLSAVGIKGRLVSASKGLGLGITASALRGEAAAGTLGIGLGVTPSSARTQPASGTLGIGLGQTPTVKRTFPATGSIGLGLGDTGTTARRQGASASKGLALGVSADHTFASPNAVEKGTIGLRLGINDHAYRHAQGVIALLGLGFHDAITKVAGSTGLRLGLAGTAEVFQGDEGSMRHVLAFGRSRRYPDCYQESPDGVLLIANGIDPMLRWDGRGEAYEAGVAAPTVGPTLAVPAPPTFDYHGLPTPRTAPVIDSGYGPPQDSVYTTAAGSTVGYDRYVARVRYLDAAGNAGPLGPASNAVAAARPDIAPVARIVYTAVPIPTDPLVVRRQLLRTASTNPSLYYIDIDTADLSSTTFTSTRDFRTATGLGTPAVVPAVAAAGTPSYVAYLRFVDAFGNPSDPSPVSPPASFPAAVLSFTYSDVQVPTSPKVVRRQLLRNTLGQKTTFYVDVDTTDLTSTTFTSTRSDDDLADQEAVPFFDGEGNSLVSSRGLPPSWKGAISAHLGYLFAAVDVPYRDGSVAVTNGSAAVLGRGTVWPLSLAGRTFAVVGDGTPYEVQSVAPAAQTLTLATPYAGPTDRFARYVVRPAPGERKLVYFCRPSAFESWDPTDAFGVQEDGDELTGLMQKDSFLYLLERRHIYRFTMKDDPGRDGFAFLSVNRGCLSNRLWAISEGIAYMLDEQGVHAFAGGQDTQPVSEPVQDLFRPGSGPGLRVNWDADARLWHASADPVRGIVRFFVHLAGSQATRLHHALCYDYRRQAWWAEEYPTPACSSAVGSVVLRRVPLCGSAGRRVIALGESAGDRRIPSLPLNPSATTPLSATVVAAAAPGDVVRVATGRGAGQGRTVVAAAGGRLELDRPWLVEPGADATLVLGGIAWAWAGGWWRLAEATADGDRSLVVTYEPTATPTAAALELTYDYAAAPRAWARTAAEDGVAATAGDPALELDLGHPSGRAVVELAGHSGPAERGDHAVSARLAGVQGRAAVRIRRVEARGVEG
jgi:hypothetical protein